MPLSLDEVLKATALLKQISDDRSVLEDVPLAEAKALLEAAGRLSNPSKDDSQRLQKNRVRRARLEQREQDRAIRAEAAIRQARKNPVFVPPQNILGSGIPHQPRTGRMLEKPFHCYVCKREFREVHHFYDSMCLECGDFNYLKRFQVAPLDGKVALITGGRVKIGYQASLMLLRSGARVIATTRFPHDASQRYLKEPDFTKWGHRLEIYGLDLRHAPSVELFAQFLGRTHDRLDILINNAAQTVRRPPGFYRHLAELEHSDVTSLPEHSQRLLEGHSTLIDQVKPRAAPSELATFRSHDPAVGLHSSAALSLVPYDLEQDTSHAFPEGRLDADLQQVDLRTVNSWRLTLGEVATGEMLEVHLVNAVAPFILCGKLRPLMTRNRAESWGHVVNVSAMEGSFSRGTKTDKHPHTNMAKAALNMMTLTSAPDYAKSLLAMNAADTGWVTDEDPVQHAERKTNELGFEPPLDIVDGAARVVDPIFEAERTGDFVWGKFFKDYKPTAW
ncbi:MAG: SDR family NAD(P)-dependent oxidoreductase [Myxococcales bacterium]|nr:SDR family NAD(P)-dependent oxidoreductase [Myxococcales bacterium]MDP3502458.1 SDR family NAD(P)-dependent oxidoreductase [Myxococcales bacterium]